MYIHICMYIHILYIHMYYIYLCRCIYVRRCIICIHIYIHMCTYRYIPGGAVRSRPIRSQGGPQWLGPQGPLGAHKGPAHDGPGGSQGPGPQRPTRAQPTRAQWGPQDSPVSSHVSKTTFGEHRRLLVCWLCPSSAGDVFLVQCSKDLPDRAT